MSFLKQSTTLDNESNLFIDETNYDPMDTLAPILQKEDFPKGFVADTPQNRANAALACCAQLMRQLRTLKKRVDELENQSGRSG
jgi:hypothetical protein